MAAAKDSALDFARALIARRKRPPLWVFVVYAFLLVVSFVDQGVHGDLHLQGLAVSLVFAAIFVSLWVYPSVLGWAIILASGLVVIVPATLQALDSARTPGVFVQALPVLLFMLIECVLFGAYMYFAWPRSLADAS